jgi:MFS family permease
MFSAAFYATSVCHGLLSLLSLLFIRQPVTSVAILMLGRAVLGGAESFIVTGAFTWGLALVGSENTGTIMAWVGTAMYAAFAIGAPVGTGVYAAYGFAGIALATGLIPLVTLLLVAPRRPVPSLHHARPAFTRVVGTVWLPGIGLAFSSVGFGAISTFIVLLFAQHGWGQAWLAFSVVSVTFMAGRLLFGHLPDRIGGAKVAFIFVLIEAAGQALIWLAPISALVLFGAAPFRFYPSAGSAETSFVPTCFTLFTSIKTVGTKNRVAAVAKINPPITARPRGAFCSPPSPRPNAIGTIPIIIASAVISTGRIRT